MLESRAGVHIVVGRADVRETFDNLLDKEAENPRSMYNRESRVGYRDSLCDKCAWINITESNGIVIKLSGNAYVHLLEVVGFTLGSRENAHIHRDCVWALDADHLDTTQKQKGEWRPSGSRLFMDRCHGWLGQDTSGRDLVEQSHNQTHHGAPSSKDRFHGWSTHIRSRSCRTKTQPIAYNCFLCL
ncbi:hypothetical protein Ddc_10987 [Ditylenchus destructor]|nr:hypothetical protein Ddc_10987 [Ditylenchus destructor]